MRESFEVPHVTKKMHSNSSQIHDLWGTAVDSFLFMKFIKGGRFSFTMPDLRESVGMQYKGQNHKITEIINSFGPNS